MSHSLLNILSIKSNSLVFLQSGFGAISKSDVSFALSGLTRLQFLFVFVCYVYTENDFANDNRAKFDACELRDSLTVALKTALRCKREKAEKYASIVIALGRTGSRCIKCNGGGDYLTPAGNRVLCKRCDGNGFFRFPPAELARLADVSADNWKRNYASNLNFVEQFAQDLKNQIWRHVNNKIVIQSALIDPQNMV